MIHLDTNAALWLYLGRPQRLPRAARNRVQRDEIVLSPTLELELAFLAESGRLRHRPADVLDGLGRALGFTISPAPFTAVVREAARMAWTRDPSIG